MTPALTLTVGDPPVYMSHQNLKKVKPCSVDRESPIDLRSRASPKSGIRELKTCLPSVLRKTKCRVYLLKGPCQDARTL